MDPRLLFTGVAVLAVIIWYLAGRIRQLQARPSPQSVPNPSPHFVPKPSPQSVSKPVVFSDPAICAQILACKGYDKTGAKNLYTDVKSRAIPNKRLIQAFGIDNSFTTSDSERRKEFNLKAGRAIKMTEAKVSTTESEFLSSPKEPVCARPEHQDLLFSWKHVVLDCPQRLC